VYAELAEIEKQSEREQGRVVEVHAHVEVSRDETRTLARGDGTACYEKLRDAARNDAELTLANGATRTEISGSLAALRIGMSPMLTIRELTGTAAIRRAFAVDRTGLVVVMTTVEAWAKYAPVGGEYAYYTANGAFLFGTEGAVAGGVLLGRFLCDETLGIGEEIALLRHIAASYDGEREQHLRTVLACLFSSRFLSEGSSLLLGELRTESARAVLRKQTAVGLSARIAHGDGTLAAMLLPIVTGMLAETGFGKAVRKRALV
jgi:hypothetical protein